MMKSGIYEAQAEYFKALSHPVRMRYPALKGEVSQNSSSCSA